MPAAETAGLASGRWRPSPDPALARWAWRPRIATRALGADPGSVRTARDFTVTTRHQRGMAERSPDIAIVVSELMTNALRHALPGSGDTGHGSRSGSACSSPGPASCAQADDPGKTAAAPANARLPRRDRPRTAPHPRAQRPVGLHHAQPDRKGRAGPGRPVADTANPGPVPEQTRPRPVAEPGSRAEPASVNDPSPAVCRTDIGHWPVTSSTGHVWITIWADTVATAFLIFPQAIKPPAFALVNGRRAHQGPIRARLPAARRHPG